MGLFTSLRPWWPLLAFLVSGALLAGAHAFETFGGLAPCAMCLEQRRVHWVILGVAVVAFIAIRLRPSLAGWAVALIGIAFLWSVYSAGHHVAVEQKWIPATCDVVRPGTDFTFDPNAPLVVPKCDEIAWSLFGISMAGYNGLISLAMALFSFLVALAPGRKADG